MKRIMIQCTGNATLFHSPNLFLPICRKNLRYGSSDALQGIAFEEGTCDVVYGAGLAQDSGLSAGQIIAHEIGHT